jgi:uncharacterized protein YqgC (DUF456 family)
MDHFFLIFAIVLLLLAVAASWSLTLLGMPGNWLLVGSAALYVVWGPTVGVAQITWSTCLALAALAAGGEIAELAAGVWGARRAGGSRRAALLSLIGSIVGALLGAMLGLPIPLLGPPIAAVLGGALGALAGAALAERTRGESSRQSLRVGKAAFLGRLLGTGAKTLVATILAVIVVVALVV